MKEGNTELKNECFLFKHDQGLAFMSKFIRGNPSQYIYSLSSGKHASTEQGFCPMYLHVEMTVLRYDKEVKKKKRS